MSERAPRRELTEWMVRVLQDLSRARDLETVMRIVRTAARQMAGADGATFVLRDGDRCFYADEDAISPLWKGQRFPMDICISGWAMLHRQTAVIEDIYLDPRIPADAYRKTFVKSLVMVPIRTEDPIGAIGVYWATQTRAPEDVVRIIQTLADSTSLCIQNVNLYQELDRRIEELTRQKELAEAASVAKSQFLANMSHELRTPVNGIMGMLQLLGQSARDKDQIYYTGLALDSSRRLLTLLDDLLDLSRIEVGKLDLRNAPFDLPRLMETIGQIFREQVGQKGLTLRVLYDAGLPRTVHGDETRLRQVLFNLVGNAVKFTPAGEVAVTVSCPFRGPGGRARLLFSIADTGIGIEDSALDLIFENFTQAESAYSRRFGGAGLGLPIARRLVQKMNGSICLDSEPGRGTICHCLVEVELPQEERAEDRAPARPPTAPAGQGPRVLLVEDDHINRVAVEAMLEMMGHRPVCAATSDQALDLARRVPFDLILMDIQLPERDGLETARLIRAEAGSPNRGTPILAVTAHAMNGDRERFLAEGLDGYLAKPVEMNELRLLMEQILSGRGTRS